MKKNKIKDRFSFLKPCLHSCEIKLTFEEKPYFSINKQRPTAVKVTFDEMLRSSVIEEQLPNTGKSSY